MLRAVRVIAEWPVRSVLLECGKCLARQTSVTAGTIFQEHAQAVDRLVPQAMYWVTTQKNGDQCAGSAAGARTEELQDRLDLVAQVAPRHGSARSGSVDRTDRGGRDFHCGRGRGNGVDAMHGDVRH